MLSYKSDDLGYVDVLLDSSSFEDLISRANVIHDLLGGNNGWSAASRRRATRWTREKDAIARREGAVADAAQVLQQKSDELAALRAAQAASQAAALAVRQQKHGRAQGRRTRTSPSSSARRTRSSPRARRSPASSTGPRAAARARGASSTRSTGPITSPFGWRIHPILRYQKFHTGVDFGVGYGTPIRAADSGTVIYATWMGGYGNVIIVDHGDGLSTLYAHQSSARRGQRRARHARADGRLRGLDGVQHRARTCTSRCGSTATPSTPWATL